MSNPPARFCAYALTNGFAERCSCTALGRGAHTREQILNYERSTFTLVDDSLHGARAFRADVAGRDAP